MISIKDTMVISVTSAEFWVGIHQEGGLKANIIGNIFSKPWLCFTFLECWVVFVLVTIPERFVIAVIASCSPGGPWITDIMGEIQPPATWELK